MRIDSYIKIFYGFKHPDLKLKMRNNHIVYNAQSFIVC